VKVRILQLGRKVLDYEGQDGVTLLAALNTVGVIAAQGMDLRINSQPATLESVLSQGDVVTIIPRIKGGRLQP